ncbi:MULTISPECIES: GNAT family N-acetyltransferase [Catenuloplanes]|uniref:RimJ/RimL family protein N-acetyltransferase n=1 Tax=Catenuloplanes niger TaxID=587534 RepID=A0AAE3ZKY7_9ACTN|nr:GNAT family N-acetyltransferase [Catenuloplanes niger]MDR7321772.1 RimJ/RimL family protein N-acetyltransferase [Catenuloplanes niger]
MYPVTLTGRVVTLREFREDDAADVHAIIGDDRVTGYLSFDSRTPAQAETMIAEVIERSAQAPRTEYYLAITLSDDRLIGFARLALGGVKAAKIGYAVRADRWGGGYATDAARVLIAFAFNRLGLHRVTAAIGPDNVGSLAVASKVGMEYEGRLRDHVFTNNAWRDSLLYSIISRS